MEIPFGDVEKFNAVVEIPIGSENKYEYDEELEQIKLDYVFDNLQFPFNYGFIPQTRGGDDDPLDVMIFSSFPLEPGIVVEVKPIGVMEFLDREEEDNKFIVVPIKDPLASKIDDLDDFSDEQLDEIAEFWKQVGVQKQKKVEIVDFHNRSRAIKEIRKALIS